MKILKRVSISIVVLVVIIFGALYMALNSSYVFDKIANKFAPQYNIRYDAIGGNILSGIELDGLYYRDKKLARKINLKLNPFALLQGRIAASHVTMLGVNANYLQYMISDISSSSSDDSGGDTVLPFAIKLNDIKITMLPYDVAGVGITQSDLRVAYIYYDRDELEFGELKLMLKSSLGRADLKGNYRDQDLYLSDLFLGSIDTAEIERLFVDKPSKTPYIDPTTDKSISDTNTTSPQSDNIFVPHKIHIRHLKATLLPRKYRDIPISLLTLEGNNADVDLDQKFLAGDLNLSLRTNIGKADISITALQDKLRIDDMRVMDIDLDKILALTISDTNSTIYTQEHSSATPPPSQSLQIPYLPSNISIVRLNASVKPFERQGIRFEKTYLTARDLQADISDKMLKSGDIDIELDTDLAHILHRGKVSNNVLTSRLVVDAYEKLYTRYSLPMRRDLLRGVVIKAITDSKHILADIKLSGKHIQQSSQNQPNIDIKTAHLQADYSFEDTHLSGKLKGIVATPYTSDVHIDMGYWMDGGFAYKGRLWTAGIRGIESKYVSFLDNLSIETHGDIDRLYADISSRDIRGQLEIKKFAKGMIHLETKRDMQLDQIVNIPKQLKGAKGKISVDMPIDMAHMTPLKPHIKLQSNVVNMDADVSYDQSLKVTSVATIPHKSILSKLDPNIKLQALSPLRLKLDLDDHKLALSAKTHKLSIDAHYDTKSSATKADINLAGNHIKIAGVSSKKLKLQTASNSIQGLSKAINTIYKTETPALDGKVKLSATIDNLQSISIEASSPRLTIGKTRKNATKIDNITLGIKADKNRLMLNNYSMITQGMHIYSNKSSKIVWNGDQIVLQELWVNDNLRATGKYNTKTHQGVIHTKASGIEIKHEMADLVAALGINTKIQGDKVSIDGNIRIKKGNIKYDFNTKTFVADSDIIIIQHQHKKTNNFDKNYKLDIRLNSTTPLKYHKGALNISLTPDLTIQKAYGNPLKMYGKIKLKPGGSYTFQNKRFVLEKGYIGFKGKPNSPSLHIDIHYRHNRTFVKVRVLGTAANPSLHFSSEPPMSREEILSFIMFDTKRGGDENIAGDLTTLMAGSLVKSLFGSMGLKLDHMVVSGKGFEMGKKISDNITIIYDKSEKSAIKVRIQNTKNIETDISFGQDSHSADIFFKKEF